MKQLVFLWDADGMLVDSEPLHVAKLIAVSKRHGVTLREEDFARTHEFPMPDGQGGMKDAVMPLHGAGDKNIYWWLVAQKTSLKDSYPQQEWLNELLEFYIANKNMLRPRPYMAALIHNLDAQGALQAVVTNGIPQQLKANMDALGTAAGKMAFMLDANDVKHSKPNPEGYLQGIKRATAICVALGLKPEDLVFGAGEDSPVGVDAVANANAYRIGRRESGIFCVQYLLPGNEPASVPLVFSDKFAAVTLGQDVERCIYNFYDAAATGTRPSPVTRLPALRRHSLGPHI